MIIAQISDTHLSADHPQRALDLAASIAHINARQHRPDIVIHTGDVAHDGTAADYAVARQIFRKLQVPLYIIPGNRDRRAAMIDALADLCPAPLAGPAQVSPFMQYTVEAGPVRLVCLDTLSLNSNKGQLCADRLAEAKELIAQDRETPTAIFMHHPPFEVAASRDPFQFESRSVADQFLAALCAAPNIAGLFCGHVHRPSRQMIGLIPATTMTSIAHDLRVGHDPAKTDPRPRYDLHIFDACTGFTTRSIIAAHDMIES